jgi:hypothetical protein
MVLHLILFLIPCTFKESAETGFTAHPAIYFFGCWPIISVYAFGQFDATANAKARVFYFDFPGVVVIICHTVFYLRFG